MIKKVYSKKRLNSCNAYIHEFVTTHDMGTSNEYILQSYNTIVARYGYSYSYGNIIEIIEIFPSAFYSTTTRQHISKFYALFGYQNMTPKRIHEFINKDRYWYLSVNVTGEILEDGYSKHVKTEEKTVRYCECTTPYRIGHFNNADYEICARRAKYGF